jgi:hypothetical protein
LARERFGHDAVRANLDLPDFFENLAGNHALANWLFKVHLEITDLVLSSQPERFAVAKLSG